MISMRLCFVLGVALAALVGRIAGNSDRPVVPRDVSDTASQTPNSDAAKPAAMPRGFHEIGSFGGSSLSEDAHIYAARVEGIGTAYSQTALVVRARPREDSPMVAYVGGWPAGDGGRVNVFAASEPGLIGELTRANHDDYGLVAERIERGWARVVYGYTARGESRKGWVRLSTEGVGYVSYDQQILQHGTWFQEPEKVELFERPNGRRVPFSVFPSATTEPSYMLEVLAIRGNWIQVRLTVPDTDPCGGDPDQKVERSATLWVRRHDARGRYQIDYAAAGC
jgi:hypothetical protein